ncbi:hypothetical protein DIPPA_30080 [Diplonema papillatum]|nr:hypothetical protein DIPPA_30080 [Diplonema papillatum]
MGNAATWMCSCEPLPSDDDYELIEPEALETEACALGVLKEGDILGALSLLEEACLTYEGSAYLLNARGVLKWSLHRFDESLADFRLASGRNPDTALYHYNCGHALMSLYDYPAAAEAFRLAFALDPLMLRGIPEHSRRWCIRCPAAIAFK